MDIGKTSVDSSMVPSGTSLPPTNPAIAQFNTSDARPQEPKTPTSALSKKPMTPFRESLQRFSRDKRAMISLGILLFFVLLALIGPLIYQHVGPSYPATNGSGAMIGPETYHDPFRHDIDYQDQPISGQFWLGTDSLGHDLLARLMQSLLISIGAAILVEVIDIGIGVTVGVLAAFYGGWIDQLLARITDIMFAFPGLLFAILLTGIFGPTTDQYLSKIPLIGAHGNARLIVVSIALAFTAWPVMARYVRGLTLQLKQQQFIEAARTSGATDRKIIIRHIVPNLFSIVVVAATLNMANTIIGEASISLLGLGVQAPGSSLGLMISDTLQSLEGSNPWSTLFPCIILVIIVLAFSFLGDGLRDAFDPRSKD